ncbi:aldehyde dehydrogenase family protein [Texcoconibacillus texcoconensis]|uniref:Glyceraldehyde-3-phosphate dehydrogenase (NADP+) n=1 Tax=Texcoconibacillus texcoconensis TaxID=1095777 RepID=A0A840QSA6_9BACI|nr:aldehyde dehydrogenase family protein [Texcoconibacillus texcoconensis]MBB5174181.1 glyceraldehyde-3-phosphate dehydrogenase (NADP+) [Texcoconibacillus texcoconensis]
MRTKAKVEMMFLAGEWVRSDETFDVYDPQDDRHLAVVPSGEDQHLKRALSKAKEVHEKSDNFPTHERIRVLQEVANYMEARVNTYAETIASEGSKTITEATKEVKRAIETIRISAEEARRINGETISFDQHQGSENRIGYQYRFPIGIIGAITPFNDPLNLVCHKVGPALAAGNPIIVKPASTTPLSALLLAEAFLHAQLPKGYLSVIPGSGRTIGNGLVTHPDVTMISFTGGLDAGEHIIREAGLKKVNMELGSNSPVIVLNDSDIDEAATSCVSGAFSAVGQNCIGVQRIYVENGKYFPFLNKLIEKAAELRVGNKMDEKTDVGPMINEEEAKRVETWVQEAISKGAKIQIGGRRNGTFYEPTILTGVPRDAQVAKEEVFGPVVIVEPVDSLQEAVQYSNDVNYGLHAGIFTSNIDKAFYAIQHLHVGGVMVNDSSDYRIDAMPFGGVKGSGLGREGVRSAIEAMTEPKVISFNLKQF